MTEVRVSPLEHGGWKISRQDVVRDFQLFVYNGNAFLFSGYPLGISLRRSICWLPKSDVGNLLAAKK